MNQNKTAFKLKKFENTRNTSTLMFEVKGARAFWDDSLSVPGTDRRGGFRCPIGTENGGQITDRFGRNCGAGIVRRVGKLFGELGDRAGIGDGTRREERRARPKPPNGTTGRERGVLAGAPSPTPETDNPFGVSSVAASATKPVDKPITPPVVDRQKAVDAFSVQAEFYAEGGILKHIMETIEAGQRSDRYRYSANKELYLEAEQAYKDVMLELPGDSPDDATKRVVKLLDTLRWDMSLAAPGADTDRIRDKTKIIRDLHNGKTFREQAALFVSEDYKPDPVHYFERQNIEFEYAAALMTEETVVRKLQRIQSLRAVAIDNITNTNRDAWSLVDERTMMSTFEKLDMLTLMESDVLSKNSDRLGWGIMLDGESATELAPGIPKYKLDTYALGDLQYEMRRHSTETTEKLEERLKGTIMGLSDKTDLKLDEKNQYIDGSARYSQQQIYAITLLLKERAALKDTADANPNGYHADGVPVFSKEELTSNTGLESAISDEWEFFSRYLTSVEELPSDASPEQIRNRNNVIASNEEQLRRRLRTYAFDMNRTEVDSWQYNDSRLRYHAALMAYDGVLAPPVIDIPDVLPEEIDSQLKEIALQEFDKRQEYLGEWMKTHYPPNETPWTKISIRQLADAVANDDNDTIATWLTGAYEIEMTGLDGREYRTRLNEFNWGDNVDEEHFGTGGEIFAYIDIEVLDADTGEWQKIGYSTRIIDPSSDAIYSASMNVEDPIYRGAGIASIYNGNSWTWAKGAGFDDIEVMAVDDGSYVWGRAGYVDESLSPDPFVVELGKYRRGIPSIITTEEQAISIQRLVNRGAESHMDWIFALENGSAEGTSEERALRKIQLGNWFKQRAPFSSGTLSLLDDEMFSLDPRIRVRRAKGKSKPKVPLLRKD